VTLLLRGTFTIETRARAVKGDVVAIAPHTDHAFSGEGLVAHLFIDPDGRQGREARRVLFSDAQAVAIPASRFAEQCSRLLATFESPRRTDEALLAIGRALVAELAPSSERDERPEARVRKMSAWAASRLDASVSLVDAAAYVGLSSGRARHLFVEETGLPFRTYVLWLRLMRAVELFAVGSSLTDAAHRAGFSDSSHLSRTFHRMFGITADSLSVI
jgi:AraC-like DNA-binding protein